MAARFGPDKRGFTLLELAVVIVIVALLAGVLLKRVIFYQEQAERVSMEQTVGILRAAMHLQMADRLLHERERPMAQLAGDNPMNWLAEKPGNYLGEYDNPKWGQIGEGNWYFDTHDRVLVYLPTHREHLQIAAGEQGGLRFRVRLSMTNSVGFSAKDGQAATQARFEGVLLEPVTPYKWF